MDKNQTYYMICTTQNSSKTIKGRDDWCAVKIFHSFPGRELCGQGALPIHGTPGTAFVGQLMSLIPFWQKEDRFY
jgi:hypothetical protein